MQTVLVATTFLDVDQSTDAKVKTIYSFYKISAIASISMCFLNPVCGII